MKDKYYLETTKRYEQLKQQRQDLDKSGIYCVKLQGYYYSQFKMPKPDN